MELFDTCGIIENCIDSTWLVNFSNEFKSLSFYQQQVERNEFSYNTEIGSKEHTLISEIFRPYIENIVNIHNPIIYSLKGRSNKVGVHSDSPLTAPHGRPYYTFLIPMNGYDIFSTFVFDQTSDTAIGSRSAELINQQCPLIDHNVVDHPELMHLSIDNRKRLSLNKKLVWKKNSILYWKSNHLHCSTNFFPPEFEDKKESLVIWTTY
jgi:hypothetical protein